MSTSVPAPIQYWSNFLRDAQKKNQEAAGLVMVDVLHHGGVSVSGSFAFMHASLVNELAATLTEDGIVRFETALTEEVRRGIERWGDKTYHLSTDYDPCEAIMRALAAGGMPEQRYGFFFPMKTIMDITVEANGVWTHSIRRD